MSDNESDNSYIWVIGIFVLIFGIVFFFSKDMWPQLTSPVLRCLVAPVAGIVIFLGYYLIYVVLPNVALQVIWKVCLWISAPRLIFPISLIFVVATGIAFLFQWLSAPTSSLWGVIASASVGTLGGYFFARLMRLFNSDSWVLPSIVSLPVTVGLTYWISIILQPSLGIWLIILAATISTLMVIRFLYEDQQLSHRPSSSYRRSSSHQQATSYNEAGNPLYLPQDMKDMILKQVRDKLGSSQYNQLVNVVGEDEIIRQVLANMQKS